MGELEEARKKLGGICQELLILMGDIEDMAKCLEAKRKEATELYMKIDEKLNEKGAKNEEQNCDTGHPAVVC